MTIEDKQKNTHLKAITELLSTLRKTKVSEEDVKLVLEQKLSSEWQNIIDKCLISFSIKIKDLNLIFLIYRYFFYFSLLKLEL